MDQNRSQERMGVMNYSQETARAAAHHAAMAGSVIGSLSAGAVGAAFGFGRNLFASGRQTVQTQMPMMQPNRSLPPIPQSFGPPTSVTAPVESSTAPIPGIYRELAQLRAESLRMRTQQGSTAGDQSYRDAQSVVGGDMEFNGGGYEEVMAQGPSSSGAYLAGMQGQQEPNGTHTQVQANGLDVGVPTGGVSATGVPVGTTTAPVETRQDSTARTQGLAQPSREGSEWIQFWQGRVRESTNPLDLPSGTDLWDEFLNLRMSLNEPPEPAPSPTGSPPVTASFASPNFGHVPDPVPTPRAHVPNGPVPNQPLFPGFTIPPSQPMQAAPGLSSMPTSTLPTAASVDESQLFRQLDSLKEADVPKLKFSNRSKPADLEEWLTNLSRTLDGVHPVVSMYFEHVRSFAEDAYDRYL